MSLKTICFDPPIPNALVVFVNPNTGKVVDGGLTDSEGKISLFLKEGTYELYVSKSGYNPYHKTVQITKDTVISVNLANPDVVDPIYLYDKSGNVINPATEDTLQTILSHVSYVGGHRYRFKNFYTTNHAISPDSYEDVLIVSGRGIAMYVWWMGGWNAPAGNLYHWVFCDDAAPHPLVIPHLPLLTVMGVAQGDKILHGGGWTYVSKWDTTNYEYDVRKALYGVAFPFESELRVRFHNTHSSLTGYFGIHLGYAVFSASTQILMLSDERVNPTDLRWCIDLDRGVRLVEACTYKHLVVGKRLLELAKATLEGRAVDDMQPLPLDQAEQIAKLGEGDWHIVELTVDERKFKHQKEFWEFIEWLQKEFNVKLLDVSMEALNIPDYIPETK